MHAIVFARRSTKNFHAHAFAGLFIIARQTEI